MRSIQVAVAACLLSMTAGCKVERQVDIGPRDDGRANGNDGSFIEAGLGEDSGYSGADGQDAGLAGSPDCAAWDGSFESGQSVNPCELDGAIRGDGALFQPAWEVCGGQLFFVGRGFAMKNGVSYFSVPTFHETKVMAIDANGTVLFESVLPGIASAPAVGDDGIAYVNHGNIALVGFDQTGKKAVNVKVLERLPRPMSAGDLAISKDGKVFLALNYNEGEIDVPKGQKPNPQYVLAAVKDGTIVWKDETYPSFFDGGPVVGADGNIYVTQLRIDTEKDGIGTKMVMKWALLKSLSPEGKLRWAVDLKWKDLNTISSPIVARDNGVLYVMVDERLFAVRDCGEKLWETTLPELALRQGTVSVRIDSQGEVVVGSATSPAHGRGDVAAFYVLSPSGKISAQRNIAGFQFAEIVLLSDGSFLAYGSRPYESSGKYLADAKIYRFEKNLNIVEERTWQRPNQLAFPVDQIGFNACGDARMVAAKVDATESDDTRTCFYKVTMAPSLDIADAPWPLERGDMARTGRVQVKGGR